MRAQLYIWPQDEVDDVKMDPSQKRSPRPEELGEESWAPEGVILEVASRELTRQEVEDALNKEGVSGEKREAILDVLFSMKFSFNCGSEEEPMGLHFEIPEPATQYIEVLKKRLVPWHHKVQIPLAVVVAPAI